jgi:hypothetical protein
MPDHLFGWRIPHYEKLTGNPGSRILTILLPCGNVAQRRKKVAHGETVGERIRLNQAPDGKGVITRADAAYVS